MCHCKLKMASNEHSMDGQRKGVEALGGLERSTEMGVVEVVRNCIF